MQNHKKQFLNNEVLSSVIRGGFQHIKIFKDNTKDEERAIFRHKVRKILNQTISEKYFKNRVDTEEHIQNIRDIQKEIKTSFGVAQKLLNLYLKYLWCLEEIKSTPPHCPVDSVVLKEAGLPNMRWSKMEEKEYREAIRVINQHSSENGFNEIADWEIVTFNKTNQTYGNKYDKGCLCKEPLCGKCLGAGCKDKNCITHTQESKDQWKRRREEGSADNSVVHNQSGT